MDYFRSEKFRELCGGYCFIESLVSTERERERERKKEKERETFIIGFCRQLIIVS